MFQKTVVCRYVWHTDARAMSQSNNKKKLRTLLTHNNLSVFLILQLYRIFILKNNGGRFIHSFLSTPITNDHSELIMMMKIPYYKLLIL